MAAVAEISNEAAVANKRLDSKPNSKPESEFTMQNLVDMFTKLNPLAKEFIPSYYSQALDHQHQQQQPHLHFQQNGSFLISDFPAAEKNISENNLANNRRVLIFSVWSYKFSIGIGLFWFARSFSSCWMYIIWTGFFSFWSTDWVRAAGKWVSQCFILIFGVNVVSLIRPDGYWEYGFDYTIYSDCLFNEFVLEDLQWFGRQSHWKLGCIL